MIQVEDLTSYPKLAQITLICYRFNIFFLNIVFNFCKSNNILSIVRVIFRLIKTDCVT